MGRGPWQTTVHGVTQLSDWHTIYFYQTHSHNKHLKLTRLELTTERSYQTHSHNISLKIARLVRRFLSRRNMSLSKILCYMTKQSKKKKKKFSLPPWEPQTPFSSRAPDPLLLLGDPGLLINLFRNWASHQGAMDSSSGQFIKDTFLGQEV